MTTVYVQFTDESKSVICGSFASPQNAEDGDTRIFGEVDSSSAEWKTYYEMMTGMGLVMTPVPDAPAADGNGAGAASNSTTTTASTKSAAPSDATSAAAT